MAKAIKTREFTKVMQGLGCSVRPGKGSHVVWLCPCGLHMITVNAGHGTIAPNALRDVSNRMGCLQIKFP